MFCNRFFLLLCTLVTPWANVVQQFPKKCGNAAINAAVWSEHWRHKLKLFDTIKAKWIFWRVVVESIYTYCSYNVHLSKAMCLDQSGYLNKNYFPGPAPSGIRRAINPNNITGTEMECSCTLFHCTDEWSPFINFNFFRDVA